MREPRLEHPLRAARRAAGIDVETLADRASTTHQTIYSIESRGTIPSTTTALRIARALGTTVEELFGRLA